MKKLLISLLVIAILISSLVFATSAKTANDIAASGDSDTNIRIGDVLYPVEKGETYTYEYRLNINKKLTAIDAALTYDTSGLELVSYEFPVLGNNNVYSGTYENVLHFNYLDTSGIAFDSNSTVLIRATFKVLNTGTYDIGLNIIDMCRYQEVKIVENEAVLSEFYSQELITDNVDDSLVYIETGGKYYKVRRNRTYNYICYLKTDTRVGSITASTEFSNYLTTNSSTSVNYSSTSGKMYDKDDSVLITIPITVSSNANNVIIYLNTRLWIKDINEDRIEDYTINQVLKGMDYTTEKPDLPVSVPWPTTAPTQAPPTQAPPTQAPTQAPPTQAPATMPPTTAPATQPSTQPYNYDLIGDVDNDGEVTSLDITFIQRWLADYTVQYPIGEKRN